MDELPARDVDQRLSRTALVAAVSQGALDAGAKQCALYTDLANPTSNKIYASVGYRPVTDVTIYKFTERSA